MAPGAAPTTSECVPIERNLVKTVFEGPEKKLVVQFSPPSEPPNDGQTALSYLRNCNGQCRSTCKSCQSRTLRRLRRDQIKVILNAARCTMLSVVSNFSTDAYLLSESSMFVSDFRITLKTCGTTTLLRALPVILRVVFETLGLEVLYVQFSRVAYLFPESQTYPHDCFDHEVAYLDHQLAMKGNVFEVASHTGSNWYLYFARLQQEHMTHCPQMDPKHLTTSSRHTRSSRSDRTLEVYMFDLDPLVMKQFMFHDRPYMTGSDNIRSGTTSQEIRALLGDCDIVDGYNFAPCGYSMNALKRNAYYTIHVSPENDASYVSFETTAHVHSFASLVAAVVKHFRPGRFTVSNVLLDSEKSQHQMEWKSWAVVSSLLSNEYSMTSDPSALGIDDTDEYVGCFASVTSFQKLTVQKTVGKSCLRSFCKSDALEHLVLSVAVRYDAYFGGTSVLEESSECGCESEDNYLPKYVVDLSRVARNWSALRTIGPQSTFRLRYAVRSNTEKGVLALLSGLDVEFEAVDASEVDFLVSLGVNRTRIVLVTPVLTTALVARFPLVGTVALFDAPAKTVHNALLQSNADVELRVVDDSGLQDLHLTLGRLAKSSLSVTSVALDTGPDSSYKVTSGEYDICKRLSYVRHVMCSNLSGVRKDLALHVGETWFSRNVLCSNGHVTPTNDILRRLLRDGVVSIDASRALLAESVSLFTRVVGRRGRRTSSETTESSSTSASYNYYLSDGAYGAFSYILMSPVERSLLMKTLCPRRYMSPSSHKKKNASSQGNQSSCYTRQKRRQDCRSATLYGPTCDALDWIWEGDLPVLDVGDSLLFCDIGAYSSASRTEFNGYGRRFDVSYVVAVADV